MGSAVTCADVRSVIFRIHRSEFLREALFCQSPVRKYGSSIVWSRWFSLCAEQPTQLPNCGRNVDYRGAAKAQDEAGARRLAQIGGR
jgi:hypothetical protein